MWTFRGLRRGLIHRIQTPCEETPFDCQGGGPADRVMVVGVQMEAGPGGYLTIFGMEDGRGNVEMERVYSLRQTTH